MILVLPFVENTLTHFDIIFRVENIWCSIWECYTDNAPCTTSVGKDTVQGAQFAACGEVQAVLLWQC